MEKLWVSAFNSDRMRRFLARSGPSRLLKSGSVTSLIRSKNYWESKISTSLSPETFNTVQTFCLFVGHNKSGTSLIGSLLDAHPEVILADEVGALAYLAAGFNREQVFHLLLRGSKREHMKGRVTARRLTPYSFLVKDQWQGRYQKLTVIGDGKAGSSTQLIGRLPALFEDLSAVMQGIQVRFIQVIRNPFDPIAVMMVRGHRSFENALSHYRENCVIMTDLRERLGGEALIAVRYEEFIQNPHVHLTKICAHLGVEAPEPYLQSCMDILYSKPDKYRFLITWDADRKKRVQDLINEYDFLIGYSFES